MVVVHSISFGVLACTGDVQVHNLRHGVVTEIRLATLLDQRLHVLRCLVSDRAAVHVVGALHSLGTLLAVVGASGHLANREADLVVLLPVLLLVGGLGLSIAPLIHARRGRGSQFLRLLGGILLFLRARGIRLG